MDNRRIKRLLIANRGEIALRVIRACRELDITSVAVFSPIDRTSLHVLRADEAYPLEGVSPRECYLNQGGILALAKRVGVDAIHPGYGFLAENADFAEAVQSAGLMFVGPSASAIRALGDKTSARRMAHQLGIPTIQGTVEPILETGSALTLAREIGFPVLLKAAAGGGGKGMRIVRNEGEFETSLRLAQSEAKGAFGDDRVYMEKYLDSPRHIEMQVLADTYGNVIYLGERECSIQRRHQKIIEESPSSIVDESLRCSLGEASTTLAKAARYSNAGTMEFLLDKEMNFYFLEMNTRLQVEHPVTEEITGIDLVHQQIRIAEGDRLEIRQADIKRLGHSIECRICAEDPDENFMPSTGTLRRYELPQGRIRIENGFQEGDEVTVFYDSLMAKVVSVGNTRIDAINVMKRALSEFSVEGVSTTIPFCQFVLESEDFVQGQFDTHFIEKHIGRKTVTKNSKNENLIAAIAAVLLDSAAAPAQAVPVARTLDGSAWKSMRREGFR